MSECKESINTKGDLSVLNDLGPKNNTEKLVTVDNLPTDLQIGPFKPQNASEEQVPFDDVRPREEIRAELDEWLRNKSE